MIKYIESKDNKLYKKIKSLGTSYNRKKFGLYLIEGKKMFLEALKSSISIELVIIRTNFNEIDLTKCNLSIITIKDTLFNELTTMKNDEGIIAVCKIEKRKLINFDENFLILDGLNDPGNMGTIIRSAESFGYNSILLVNNCVDIYNSKVLRASMGSIFRVNIVEINIDDLYNLKNTHALISMTLSNDSEYISNMTHIGKHAIIIGNEANGISKDIINLADYKAIIPISKDVESLNAAIAASITMFYFNIINIEKEKRVKNSL